MPIKEEVYDNFLAHAGKCPKCGEFLFVKIQGKTLGKFYEVYKECLSEDCDYEELISNSFNEAMGLREPRSSLDRIDEKRKEIKQHKETRQTLFGSKSIGYYTPSSPKPIRQVPSSYWDIDDPINHTIKCPFCGSVNKFDTQFSVEQKSLVHKCLVCGAEFALKDMDFATGIGTMKIIKGGRLQPDPDLQTKFLNQNI